MLSYDVCECGAPLQRVERETPQPTGSEIVLRVIAAGVCHSDLHIWDGYYDIGGGQKLRLADRGVTHTSLVPTQVHDLVKADLRAPETLKAIVVGGGHLDAATGRLARTLGWPVLASYGMTEAASQIATQTLERPSRSD